MSAGADDVIEFGCGQRLAAGKAPLAGMPDHDAVLVSLRQVEAVALQDGSRPVERAAGGDGVGDLAFRQQLQRLAGVIRDRRLPVSVAARPGRCNPDNMMRFSQNVTAENHRIRNFVAFAADVNQLQVACPRCAEFGLAIRLAGVGAGRPAVPTWVPLSIALCSICAIAGRC